MLSVDARRCADGARPSRLRGDHARRPAGHRARRRRVGARAAPSWAPARSCSTRWTPTAPRPASTCELIAAVRAAVDVPVVASGGAGAVEHFAPAVEAGADAVLAASVFHFGQLRIGEVKRGLARRRPLCVDASRPSRSVPRRGSAGRPWVAADARPGRGRGGRRGSSSSSIGSPEIVTVESPVDGHERLGLGPVGAVQLDPAGEAAEGDRRPAARAPSRARPAPAAAGRAAPSRAAARRTSSWCTAYSVVLKNVSAPGRANGDEPTGSGADQLDQLGVRALGVGVLDRRGPAGEGADRDARRRVGAALPHDEVGGEVAGGPVAAQRRARRGRRVSSRSARAARSVRASEVTG